MLSHEGQKAIVEVLAMLNQELKSERNKDAKKKIKKQIRNVQKWLGLATQS